MPSLKLDGRDVDLEDLLPEELQGHLDHCRLLFPKWRTGYQVILAGACAGRLGFRRLPVGV